MTKVPISQNLCHYRKKNKVSELNNFEYYINCERKTFNNKEKYPLFSKMNFV